MNYKIISEVEKSDLGIKIRAGRCYNFKLKPDINHYIKSPEADKPDIPIPFDYGILIPHDYKTCGGKTRTTLIRIDGRSARLYYASNLKGLYFIQE